MITYSRLLKEQEVLAAHMQPNTYQFMDMDTRNPYVIMAAMTNSGKVYTLKIHLEQFPESVPQVEVLNPLKDKNGKRCSSLVWGADTMQSRLLHLFRFCTTDNRI